MAAPIWKEIFHGAYKINKSGTIVRVIPACGTRADRRLNPYQPTHGALYVKLSFENEQEQFKVSELVRLAHG